MPPRSSIRVFAAALLRNRAEVRRSDPRARSTSTRTPYSGAGSVRALAAPASVSAAARKPPRADGVLRAARHAHGDVDGWRDPPPHAYRPTPCGLDHST